MEQVLFENLFFTNRRKKEWKKVVGVRIQKEEERGVGGQQWNTNDDLPFDFLTTGMDNGERRKRKEKYKK